MRSNWYLWPKESQKALIHMLNMAKAPKKITVADIIPLNVNTFILVCSEENC